MLRARLSIRAAGKEQNVAVVVDFEGSRREGAKPALDQINALVADDLVKVNQVIVDKMDSPVALIPQLAGHIIAAGGKRLRPMLTLASSALCGYQGERHVSLAACVEFIHTATLLHDDVVDDSDLRRGQDSAKAVWGNQASVLVGDFLFSRAFQLMVGDGSLRVLKILSDASATIAEGEVMQLMTTNDTETSEAAYMDVIRAKTAKLFAAATEIGAVVSERPAAEAEALESYGMNFGIAFQLVDDVLDYSAEQTKLGKTIGDDFREGKITLPVVLAWRRGSEAERAFWRRTLEEMDQREGDLEHAIALMNQHDALSDTIERARHYGSIARDALGLFPDSEIKGALTGLIDFCIERAY
ncbi:MAG: polyprenyl synthetase family protein [Alphaproteobacteria bacterium]|nr:polyprenyl synthetase family protein [Alphaproteobacteria bacterium]